MAWEKAGNVLIVGGGVAGIQSALDLAESGVQVYLIEKTPSIGGVLPQLDKQFPTNHCGMCRMLPVFDPQMASQFCLRRGLRHANIELVTNAQVESAEGSVGQFVVSIKENAAYVNPNRCTGCGRCAEVCPVQVTDRFQGGLSSRKAIYVKYPQVIPNVYVIDKASCTKCGECVKSCPTKAIDLSKEDTTRTLKVGAIILSGGFEEFDATQLKQYGYKKYPNVFSNIELERMLSGLPASQTGFGKSLPTDLPQKVAFIQCVGSRDSQRDYCSSACCMYAIKEAAMLRDLNPGAEICVFFMDLRAFGKTHHRCFEDIKRKGIRFIRCKIPSLEGAPDTDDLVITYETEEGELRQERFGMVVLSVGQSPPAEAEALSSAFGIKLNKYGFCDTRGVDTSVEGIYACGSFTGPKDIETTIIEASAAAYRAARCLPFEKDRVAAPKENLPARSFKDEDPRMGIFLCSCGGEIGDRVDLSELSEFSRQLPHVCLVEGSDYLCFQDALTSIRGKIDEFHLDRVILGTCEIHSREESYQRIVGDTEFDPSLLDVVDLREQLAWVHGDKVMATKKATSLIAMAHHKLSMQRAIPIFKHQVIPRALVIGGGISGLTAAISIAEQGFEVHVVEKESELGGNLKNTFYTLEGLDVSKLLKETLDTVTKNSLIHIYKKSQVMSIEGSAGDFGVHITSRDGKLSRLQYGAIVVATGAHENEPQEYYYGTDPRIITQKELESMIAQKSKKLNRLNTVVMIQCVSSRDGEHPYCSRVCCSQAIKNSLKMKEANPGVNLYVLYRDMMLYGFKEEYYTAARDKGITFLRYDADEKPAVKIDKGNLLVQIADPILEANLFIDADLLVLSPGIVPNPNGELAESLGVPLDEDYFFQEADIKFRPLDLIKPGIFCCGLARSPGCLQESIVQAKGVASRVMAFFSKGEITARKQIPIVVEEICSGCGLCVRACPYDARKIDAETRIAKVSGLLCQCCGDCAIACPNGATQQVHLARNQILAMVDAAIDL
jgi:heterodisulfide reductase subunit A